MKRMLDGLMGTNRDERPEVRTVRNDFMAGNVCKSYLLGLCPFDLFHMTKYKAGVCEKIHDPSLKADFEQASVSEGFGYEVDQLLQLQQFVNVCDWQVVEKKARWQVGE